jgi:hypothetical protein
MLVMWYVCSFHTRRVRTHEPVLLPNTRMPACFDAPSGHVIP